MDHKLKSYKMEDKLNDEKRKTNGKQEDLGFFFLKCKGHALEFDVTYLQGL